MANLYEQLGGADGLEPVVETFYRYVLTDSVVQEFFDDVDMDAQIAKQKAFLTMVLGGPNRYTGRDLRSSHTHLVERGVNDTHFDKILELIGKALSEHGVGQDGIAEVFAICEGARNDVLNH